MKQVIFGGIVFVLFYIGLFYVSQYMDKTTPQVYEVWQVIP